METFASLLGGLGLFLTGIRAIGTNLQLLAGPRLRRALGMATRGPVATACLGLALGGLTQSSSAVATIITSLVTAGLLPVRPALSLLAFANVGTAGLVLLATVDLRLMVLWLAGLVGFLSAFGVDRTARMKPVLGALLGLALLFLGLDLLKAGAGPLAASPVAQALMGQGAGSLPAAFLVALAFGLAVQSASTVTILAIALLHSGVIGVEQAALGVCGALLGSGLAVLLPGMGMRGAARRLPTFQALTRAGVVALLLLVFAVEEATGLPLLLALLAVGDPERAIGLLFLGAQLACALLPLPVMPVIERLLARLCPESAAEVMARPAYLYDGALEDPATALELVRREQHRLLARLPGLLDPLREEVSPSVPRQELLEGAAALERAILHFLADLRQRGAAPEVMEGVVAVESRVALLAALRETLAEFGDGVMAGRQLDALAPLQAWLVEALHMLLEELIELASDPAAAEPSLLRGLTEDRAEMMEALRRRLLGGGGGLCHAGQDLLFRSTSLFERGVWLTRRLALGLEGPR